MNIYDICEKCVILPCCSEVCKPFIRQVWTDLRIELDIPFKANMSLRLVKEVIKKALMFSDSKGVKGTVTYTSVENVNLSIETFAINRGSVLTRVYIRCYS